MTGSRSVSSGCRAKTTAPYSPEKTKHLLCLRWTAYSLAFEHIWFSSERRRSPRAETFGRALEYFGWAAIPII